MILNVVVRITQVRKIKKKHQLNNQTRQLTVIQSLPNARYSHFPHSEHVRQVSSNNVQPFLS